MDLETRESLGRVLILARVFVDKIFQVGQENQRAIAKVVAWLDTLETVDADALPADARSSMPTLRFPSRLDSLSQPPSNGRYRTGVPKDEQ